MRIFPFGGGDSLGGKRNYGELCKRRQSAELFDIPGIPQRVKRGWPMRRIFSLVNPQKNNLRNRELPKISSFQHRLE